MKYWLKVLALCCVCGLAGTLFVSCGPKANATATNDAGQNQTPKPITPPTEQPGADDETTPNNPNDANEPSNPSADSDDDDTDPTEPEPHQHTYSNWEIIEPTCTAGGYTQRTCNSCDAVETKDHTDPIPHQYQITDTVAATCTTPGSITRTCQNCDATETEALATTEHDPNEHTRRCNICNALTIASPMEDLTGSYWRISGTTIVFYFNGYDAFTKTYRFSTYQCDENGEIVLDKLDKPKAYPYQGTYEVDQSHTVIKFTDESTTEVSYHNFEFSYRTSIDSVTGETVFTLSGSAFLMYPADTILTFIGYAL